MRRLAVIDPSPAGRQPMCDRLGSLHIVFNGEIYNFPDLRRELEAGGFEFRSRSDTEVILAGYRRWGRDCVTRLNGMFAFAIYDSARMEIFAARDRAGEKPLYYRKGNDGLWFASELKALLADPAQARRLDTSALSSFLAYGFAPTGSSLLRGIRKLPPAHALVYAVDSGSLRTWRYWSLPDPAGSTVSGARLTEELEALLEDAVRRQLVADVPVGVLLSGGVDSSLVTALASRSSSRIKAFTVRFPGSGRYDETEHARLVARRFAAEHVELVAASSSVALLPMLARQFDEPVMDSSMLPTYLVTKLVREHCTVALGGDGGDELFGGYPHHSGLLRMRQCLARVPGPLRRLIAASARRLLPNGFRGRRWFVHLDAGLDETVPPIATYFDAGTRRRLLDGLPPPGTLTTNYRGSDLLERATRADFEHYLANDILVKVDRASMLNSLEVRAPLLDHRIVEFAFGKVPSHLKASASERKILLKMLAARLLPSGFDQRRKQGFSIPVDAWLRTRPWRDFLREVLLGDHARSLFDRRAVGGLFARQALGMANGERLFGLALFELWRREYGVTL
jgi:asparagine synthase (glutamine-hydrolysing)